MATQTTAWLADAARTALDGACDAVREAGAGDAVDGVAPAVVTAPTSTEEVASVLAAAHAHDLAVVARGRGTKLTWGLPPSRCDVVVDVSGLDRVLEHAAGDLIVRAQAGTRLADLQAAVAAAGQRLLVDETVPGASIGGSIATAAAGPSRVAVGTVRDLLIGVTVVRADGVVAKAGGRVVKNVAGYDLGKLVTGSFGTLAVVTDAFFRLHPLPEARRWVSVEVADPAAAQRAGQAVVQGQVVPSAVEVDLPAGGPGTVTVLLEGLGAGVEGRAATTASLLTEATGATVSHAEAEPAGWGRYPWHDDGAAAGRDGDRATGLKLTTALSGVGDVLAAARDAAAAAGVPVALRGSAGAGVLYGALPAGTDAAAVAAVVEATRVACTARGGSLVVLDAPPEVRDAVDVWGPVPAIDLMRRVKDQFDPGHLLAPGRFVGEI